MKVILRIAGGITTKTLNISESLVATEFRVPIIKKMNLAIFQKEQVQELLTPESTKQKCLIFRWDGKSRWGSGSPIMDLVDCF